MTKGHLITTNPEVRFEGVHNANEAALISPATNHRQQDPKNGNVAPSKVGEPFPR